MVMWFSDDSNNDIRTIPAAHQCSENISSNGVGTVPSVKDKIKCNKNVSNICSRLRHPNANKCVTAVSKNQYCLQSARIVR